MGSGNVISVVVRTLVVSRPFPKEGKDRAPTQKWLGRFGHPPLSHDEIVSDKRIFRQLSTAVLQSLVDSSGVTTRLAYDYSAIAPSGYESQTANPHCQQPDLQMIGNLCTACIHRERERQHPTHQSDFVWSVQSVVFAKANANESTDKRRYSHGNRPPARDENVRVIYEMPTTHHQKPV